MYGLKSFSGQQQKTIQSGTMSPRPDSVDGCMCLLICLAFGYLLMINGLAIDGSPRIDDVGEDKGDEQADPGHGAEGKLAGAGIGQGERRLQVGIGGIVGSVVPTDAEEQGKDGEHDADAGGPNTGRRKNEKRKVKIEGFFDDAEKDEHDANQEEHEQVPGTEEIVEVLVRLHEDDARSGVTGIAVLEQCADEESEEEDEESHSSRQQLASGAGKDGLVAHIIYYIERTENASQEEDGKTEDEIPGVEQCVEAVGGVCPAADDRREGRTCRLTNQEVLADNEVTAIEEGSHGTTQQKRADDAVENEEALKGACAQQVAELVLELIADSLQHEGEQDEHPQPVGTAETSGIEQREGGEECTAKGYQRGEGELPFATCRVDEQAPLLRGVAYGENK